MALKSRNKVSAVFSMSSMTDIVFLLLIFFMLTSTLVTTNALDLVLPNSTAQTVKKQRVSVSINENLEYYIDKEQVELKYIEAELIEKLAGQEEQVVVLRVDKAVAIEHAVAVMDIAYRNKFKIVLATQQKK
ncbi:biopolymer transporter ExbD [Flavobacteriales bacterium]|nr:biopolymer transporter ExbD [Flavobacteriales bacterium]MDB2442556.1 biopolymer transporter ExbD [Flavobacteriales bacterium]MDG1395473.1 biopolymer transporter ExbD [Flavobacteriales bacterium]|tara:strand:+ start:185 stop:580 length:396 start_codon:yes stop_codon:yes gene_type:complete